MMKDFDPHRYGREFSQLLATNRCRSLDGTEPADGMRGPLRSLTVESAFRDQALADPQMARCCLAGIWLLYDFLDESHRICQDIETPEGSFWHAIMHRREGDFSNAKYWFRRVGNHPVFPQLLGRARYFAEGDPQTDAVDQLADSPSWDPFAFVDLCEQAVQGLPDVRQECELIQQAEWELLFDHCYRSAIKQPA